MPDDRPVEEPVDQVAKLQRQLDDLKTTLTSRLGRRPTGDIEATIRTTPKQNTLICNGQVVNRADYTALWQWAQDNSLVRGGLFGNGNGSTTFTLPDFRGRVVRGLAASGESIGDLIGSDTRSITTSNMPSHDHGGNTNSYSHDHGDTDGDGDHGGHNAGSSTEASALPGSQDYFFSVAETTQNSNGFHSHNIPTDSHNHTIPAQGSGAPFDTRQASVAVNWLIWI